MPAATGARLVRLYLTSRRALPCLLALAACAVALRTELHWIPASGVASRQLPLTFEVGAAAMIGVTTRSPFGEPERATAGWLPLLRLGATVAVAGDAVGALAAGSASAHLPGGTLACCATSPGSMVWLARYAALNELPESSRNTASTPYGRSAGSCGKTTPRAESSS